MLRWNTEDRKAEGMERTLHPLVDANTQSRFLVLAHSPFKTEAEEQNYISDDRELLQVKAFWCTILVVGLLLCL